MTSRTIELAKATQSLAEYAQQLEEGTIVVTDHGRPIAAVVALRNTDAETVALSENPQFLAIIERSRVRQEREGGIASADMRQRFGAPPPPTP
jgi:antitoxin (DNA-binding transcriptional repressor) of toxin-antitoxin stability system